MNASWSPLDLILGPGVRRVAESDASAKTLYLTFDDGPDPRSTPAILEILRERGAAATFFVIAERALDAAGLLREIRADGHAIGNHSLDHRFGRFFTGKRRMLDWIDRSEKLLAEAIGSPTVGFRPPAGVRTPELHWALRKLDLPLVLWDERFFDAVGQWTETHALRSLGQLRPGAIVLLHDAQPPRRLDGFLKTLTKYIETAQAQGFELRALTRELCSRQKRDARASD